MSDYEKAYMKGYLEGCGESDMEHMRKDGGRAGWICMCIAIYACTAFSIAASVIEVFGLG